MASETFRRRPMNYTTIYQMYHRIQSLMKREGYVKVARITVRGYGPRFCRVAYKARA